MPTETPAATSATAAADERAMRLALDQAQNAWLAGEVPVGAVILRDDEQGLPQVVATGYNRPITTSDPTAHAEIVALRHAAQLLANYRLPECTLYVTLEPCAMCAMALMHARLKRVVFGARDPKTGACGSLIDLFAVQALNHHTGVEAGCLESACATMLREFFVERRAEQKARHIGAVPGAPAAPDSPGQDALALPESADPPNPPSTAAPEVDPIPVGLAVEIDFPDIDDPRPAS